MEVSAAAEPDMADVILTRVRIRPVNMEPRVVANTVHLPVATLAANIPPEAIALVRLEP